MIDKYIIAEASKRIIAFMHDRVKVAPYSELRAFMHEELTRLLEKSSPTPAGSVSDSDMLPDAPGSQSREPGESKARQGEGDSDQ